MKAVLVDQPFSDDGWLFERKLDGVRCAAFREAGAVRLVSRSGRDVSGSHSELVEGLGARGPELVADGEVVAFAGAVTSFARRAQELVVGGWTEPRGSRKGLGALLVGYHEDGRLRYAGKVGSGFDDATLATLRDALAEREIDRPPFAGDRLPRHSRWARPELVVQIAFTEWTRDGRPRHPRYLGLRDDKPAREVMREEPAP